MRTISSPGFRHCLGEHLEADWRGRNRRRDHPRPDWLGRGADRKGGPAGLRRYVQRTAAAVFQQARFQLADDRGRCERGGKIVSALAQPFPWSGGKRRLARRIVGLLPPHAAHGGPFAGSLAVVRAQPPAGAETVNDVDGAVVEVWCTLRNRLGALRQSHPASNSHGSCHPFGGFEGDHRSGIERHQNRNPDTRRQHTRLSRPLVLNDKEEPTLRLGRRRARNDFERPLVVLKPITKDVLTG